MVAAVGCNTIQAPCIIILLMYNGITEKKERKKKETKQGQCPLWPNTVLLKCSHNCDCFQFRSHPDTCLVI